MGSISKRKLKNGSFSYHTSIRKKNHEIIKSFSTEEDAKLFIFHKERLIDLIENFEIPIEQRIMIKTVFELKQKSMKETSPKEVIDMQNSAERVIVNFGEKIFCHELAYDDWVRVAKSLLDDDVYRGAKNENGKRKMSPLTLRKIFAHASSAISFVQKQGINIENHPLQVMKTFIAPILEKTSK